MQRLMHQFSNFPTGHFSTLVPCSVPQSQKGNDIVMYVPLHDMPRLILGTPFSTEHWCLEAVVWRQWFRGISVSNPRLVRFSLHMCLHTSSSACRTPFFSTCGAVCLAWLFTFLIQLYGFFHQSLKLHNPLAFFFSDICIMLTLALCSFSLCFPLRKPGCNVHNV